MRKIYDHLELFTKNQQNSDELRLLLQYLFPLVKHVYSRGVDFKARYDSLRTEKRLCHWGCFNKYFSYHIPPSEIADKEIEIFISQLSKKGEDEIEDEIRNSVDLNVFLERLSSFYRSRFRANK